MCYMALRPVSRGPIFEKIDDFFNHKRNGKENRRRVLDKLINKGQSIDVILRDEGILDARDVDEYEGGWFNGPPGIRYWPLLQFTREILTGGYRKALEISLGLETDGWSEEIPTTGLSMIPLYTQWLCGDNDFQCIVAKSDWQVTLTVFTPDPPSTQLPLGPITFPEKIWLVGSHSALEGLTFVADQQFDGDPNAHTRVQLAATRSGASEGPPYVAPIYGEDRAYYNSRVIPASDANGPLIGLPPAGGGWGTKSGAAGQKSGTRLEKSATRPSNAPEAGELADLRREVERLRTERDALTGALVALAQAR